jgi:hypothetical protein
MWTTLVAEIVTGQVDVSDWNGVDNGADWEMATAMFEDEAELVEPEDVMEVDD